MTPFYRRLFWKFLATMQINRYYVTLEYFENFGYNKVQEKFDRDKWKIESNFEAFLEKLNFNEEA